MFYCDDCAGDWPKSHTKSLGTCEICRKHALCNDVPSNMLPVSVELKEEEISDNEKWIYKIRQIKSPIGILNTIIEYEDLAHDEWEPFADDVYPCIMDQARKIATIVNESNSKLRELTNNNNNKDNQNNVRS